MKRTLYLLLLLPLGNLFTSCVSHHELINFEEAELPYDRPEAILNAMDPRIQPEDLLRITVHSFDEEAAAPFNLESADNGGNRMMQGGAGAGGNNSLELFMGYFVDREGYIDFPNIGRVAVGGLTLDEAKFKLYDLIRPQLSDAVINIRYLNFKITVLGEVNVPGTIRLTNKRVTILEALGIAGDLSDYANRRNILVIREKEGQRSYARIDLKSNAVFSSPYFYLEQNDVIYVEPSRSKVATIADPAQRIISYSTAALSLVSLIIALTR